MFRHREHCKKGQIGPVAWGKLVKNGKEADKIAAMQ